MDFRGRYYDKAMLLVTGFVQVYFVSINTCFLAEKFLPGIIPASFLISYIWSINVRKVAFGGQRDRVIYSIGASLGSVSGLLTSSFILKTIQLILNL